MNSLSEKISDTIKILVNDPKKWSVTNGIYNVIHITKEDYKYRTYHQFIIPPLINGNGYTSIISADAFFRGIKKYNHRPDKSFYYLIDNEFDGYIIANDRNNIHIGPYQIFQYGSLWDFYNSIGWNWKKKRWNW